MVQSGFYTIWCSTLFSGGSGAVRGMLGEFMLTMSKHGGDCALNDVMTKLEHVMLHRLVSPECWVQPGHVHSVCLGFLKCISQPYTI